MQSDRELLELAAKAVGLVTYGDYDENIWAHPEDQHPDTASRWNPMVDDSDALRLAADLDLFGDPSYWHWLAIARLSNSTDKHANVRRAIVRAAAAIGKEM